MSVSQLPSRCWALHPGGGSDGTDLRHWDTEALALRRLDELPAAKRAGVTLQRFPQPCWEVICDICETSYADEDDASHSPDPASAEQWASEGEWVITISGLAYCPGCVPECDRADLVIVALCAGQISDEEAEALRAS
jgi:hypothetical protein